jgi:hypothetical protein
MLQAIQSVYGFVRDLLLTSAHMSPGRPISLPRTHSMLRREMSGVIHLHLAVALQDRLVSDGKRTA